MREIKFRAWDLKSKNWFVDGFSTTLMIDFYGSLNRVQEDSCETPYRNVDDYILMQYTGLKDKNGVEIYEGDIVKIKELNESWKTKVRFENGGFCIDVEEQDYNVTLLGFLDDEVIVKVIGNIYENPELL